MGADAGKEIYAFDSYILDVGQRSLVRGGELLELRGKGFDVLVHLIRNQGQMLSKEVIFEAVWQKYEETGKKGGVYDPNLVDQALSSIRRVIGRDEADRLLRTERAQGVAFVGRTKQRRIRYGFHATAAMAALIVLVGLAVVWFNRTAPAPELEGRPRPITATSNPKFGPFVGDAQRIFFTEHENNRFRIGWADMTTGHTGVLQTSVDSPAIAGISPDRNTLLIRGPVTDYHYDAPLYFVSRNGGTAIPLNIVGFDGEWFPDGNAIAYTMADEILRYDLSTRTQKTVLKQQRGDIPWWPRFAPDGLRLRYSVFGRQSQVSTTWEMNLRTGFSHKVSDTNQEWETAACGEWDIEGTGFFFQVGKANGPFTIWWKSEQSAQAQVRRVTSPGPFNYQFPTARVVAGRLYARGQHTKAEMKRLFSIESNEMADTFQADVAPAYSIITRDGRKSLSYRSNPHEELLLIDMQTKEQRVLVPYPLQSTTPTWAPDGRRVAVPIRQPGDLWRIHLIDVQSGGREALKLLDTHCIDPSWDPVNTKEIAFGLVPVVELGPLSVALYSVNVDSKQITKVRGSDGLYRPVWAPDGSAIAAIDAKTEQVKLLKRGEETWVQTGVFASYLAWTADSKAIVFTKDGRGSLEILALSIPTMKAKVIRSIAGFKHFGPWIGTMPDGSLLIPRDLSTQEIYELRLGRGF